MALPKFTFFAESLPRALIASTKSVFNNNVLILEDNF